MFIEKAYAKINLFLNVTERRGDGFHNLQTIMAPLELHDSLFFEECEDIIVTSNVYVTEKQEDNLVYKIANYLKSEYSIEKGIKIHIEKRIPMGAGLAGGSADAAATLRGLNHLWQLGLQLDDLSKIGAKFGSDIPFCVYNKVALAESRGEELKFFDNHLDVNVLLVNPNIHISTKDVFQNLDLSDIHYVEYKDVIDALKINDYELLVRNMYNVLEKSTFTLDPRVRTLKDDLIQFFDQGVLMSGSGSTVYAISKGVFDKEIIAQFVEKKHVVIQTKLL